MFTTIVSLLASIAKFLPYIAKVWGAIAKQVKKITHAISIKRTKKAVEDAVQQRDQREIETEHYSGKPSGIGDIVPHTDILMRERKPNKGVPLDT